MQLGPGGRQTRRVPRGVAAALLRTRPGVRGEHFSLHWKMLPGAPGVLFMAIPKRLMRRAVDRNAIRRVAREAWRAASLAGRPVAAMLRMTRAPSACGARQRKAIARAELDRAFRVLADRVGAGPAASSGTGIAGAGDSDAR